MQTTRLRSTAIAAVTMGAALLVAPGSSARTTQGATLPAPTFSSTDLHVGDEVDVSGTGCVDPDSGSGAGLQITTFRFVDGGRSGSIPGDLAIIDVEPDGSYDGTITIGQPLANGPLEVQVKCGPDGADPYGETFAAAVVQVTGTTPSLPDLSGTVGGSIELTLPCDIEGGGYGAFTIALLRPEGAVYLSLGGSFPYGDSPDAGDVIQVPVPADTPVGTFPATAQCGVSQAGASALYAGFEVTIAAAGGPATPAAPAPAVPTAGAPSYTG